MTGKLSGRQVQEISEAILDAYRSVDALRIMVRIELEETLEEIAGGENFRVVTFNLITWAERTGRVEDLVRGASRHNPGNQALRQLMQGWLSAMPSGPKTSGPAARGGTAMLASPVSIDLFLSYCHTDVVAMREVQEALRAAGLSVWTDIGLEPGTRNWEDAIEEAVKQASVMVVLLSPNAKQSQWVRNEISFAQAKNKRIFPVLIAGDPNNVVPISLISAQWVDGRGKLRQAVTQDLLPALHRYVDRARSSEIAPKNTAARAPDVSKASSQAAPQAAAPAKAQQQTPLQTAEVKPKQNTSVPPAAAPPKVQRQAPPQAAEAKPKPNTSAPQAAALPKPQPRAPARTDERKPMVEHERPRDLPRWKQIGIELIRIPAGEFLMGSDKKKDPKAQDDELPQHTAFLDEYFIAIVPVTNRQYKAFVDATGHRTPNHWKGGKIPDGKENHPVVYVSWDDAQKFCQWVGLQLPSEQQWEKAARGTGGCIYPWGNTPPDKNLCNFGNNVGDTTPVGMYPKGASPYGVLDMAGTVFEWVSDWYQKDYYSTSPSRNLAGPSTGKYRILRGGSWGNPGHMLRAAYRDTNPPEYWNLLSGFRCVRRP